MARETTKWPSTRWPITKIMSSDGCNGNRVPLEMGPWYDFREFGCHLGNVGLKVLAHEWGHAYTHVGLDIDGTRWPSDGFSETDKAVKEGLAQFCALKVVEDLKWGFPEGLDAYNAILPRQPKPTFPIYHPNSWKSYHFPTAKGTVSPMQPSDGMILVIGPRLEGHSVIFLAIQTHLSCRFLLAVDSLGLRRSGSSSQIINQAQDFPEQVPRHRHLV